MTRLIKGVLNNNRKSILLTYMHKAYNECRKTNTLPMEYIDKILSTNDLYCYHCMKKIELGENYECNRRSGGFTKRKYYHIDCYDKMHY